METVSLYIRNLDKGLHLRIKQEAKKKGYSMNEYILKLLEENDPLEKYKKLYMKNKTHQQAQNTKVLKEVASKQDKILNILESVDY
jgi:hypothetical protein